MGDPVRQEMLSRLRSGEHTAGALGEGLPISQPAASQHLKVLREAGLVRVRKQGRRRLYRLAPERLREAHDWLAHYRAFWEARLDELEEALDHDESLEGEDGDAR